MYDSICIRLIYLWTNQFQFSLIPFKNITEPAVQCPPLLES